MRDLQDQILVQQRKRNKVHIEIRNPVLELPFNNNESWREYWSQENKAADVYNIEEKWVISMGGLIFTNFEESVDQFDRDDKLIYRKFRL